jgi:hypothetical protein
MEPAKDYTPLYQAVEQLPKGQKSVVVQHYGLYETETKDFTDLYQELEVSLGDVSNQHKKGLRKLQAWLAPVYPSLYDQDHRPCARSNPATTVIPPDVQACLEQVCQEKAAQGQAMDAFKLRKAARVAYRYASAYLRQKEATV